MDLNNRWTCTTDGLEQLTDVSCVLICRAQEMLSFSVVYCREPVFRFKISDSCTLGELRAKIAAHYSLQPNCKLIGLPKWQGDDETTQLSKGLGTTRLDQVYALRVIGTKVAAAEKLLAVESCPTTHVYIMTDEVEAAQLACERFRDEEMARTLARTSMRTKDASASVANRYNPSFIHEWLNYCVLTGDLAEVKTCIEVHRFDRLDGLMRRAAAANQISILRYLCQRTLRALGGKFDGRANTETVDHLLRLQNSLLAESCQYGRIQALECLCGEFGADLQLARNAGNLVLLAAVNGHFSTVRWLVQRGVRIGWRTLRHLVRRCQKPQLDSFKDHNEQVDVREPVICAILEFLCDAFQMPGFHRGCIAYSAVAFGVESLARRYWEHLAELVPDDPWFRGVIKSSQLIGDAASIVHSTHEPSDDELSEWVSTAYSAVEWERIMRIDHTPRATDRPAMTTTTSIQALDEKQEDEEAWRVRTMEEKDRTGAWSTQSFTQQQIISACILRESCMAGNPRILAACIQRYVTTHDGQAADASARIGLHHGHLWLCANSGVSFNDPQRIDSCEVLLRQRSLFDDPHLKEQLHSAFAWPQKTTQEAVVDVPIVPSHALASKNFNIYSAFRQREVRERTAASASVLLATHMPGVAMDVIRIVTLYYADSDGLQVDVFRRQRVECLGYWDENDKQHCIAMEHIRPQKTLLRKRKAANGHVPMQMDE